MATQQELAFIIRMRDEANAQIAKLGAALRETGEDAGQLSLDLQATGKGMNDAAVAADKLQREARECTNQLGLFEKETADSKKSVDGLEDEVNKLGKTSGQAGGKLDDAADDVKKLGDESADAATKIDDAWQALQRGVAALAVFTGAGALAVKTTKQYADFEEGLLAVGKTTGLVGEDLEKLGGVFRKMATDELPFTHAEILEVAEVAGQLGIQGSENISKFTATLLKLATASDVQGGFGAEQLAQFLNVTKTAPEDVDRVSAALVDLGNNSASTEAKILGIASTLAAGVAGYGVSVENLLALSTAVAEVGQEAEATATSTSEILITMEKAARQGGDELGVFASVLGITSEEFRKLALNDPTEALFQFLEGLSRLEADGKGTVTTLDALGLSGARTTRLIKPLVNDLDRLRANVERASNAFNQNTALQREFEIKMQGLNAQAKLLGNSFRDLGISIGSNFADVARPAIAGLTVVVQTLKEGFDALPGPMQKILTVGTTIFAMFVALGLAMSVIVPLLPALSAGFASVTGVVAKLATGFKLLTVAMATNPFVLLGVAITAAVAALIYFRDEIMPIGGSIASLGDYFRAFGQVASEVWGTISSYGQAAAEFLVSAWNAWWKECGWIFTMFGDLAGKIFGAVVTGAKWAASATYSYWKTAIQSIGQILQNAGKAFGGFLSAGLLAAKGDTAAATAALKDALGQDIIPSGKELADNLKKNFQEADKFLSTGFGLRARAEEIAAQRALSNQKMGFFDQFLDGGAPTKTPPPNTTPPPIDAPEEKAKKQKKSDEERTAERRAEMISDMKLEAQYMQELTRIVGEDTLARRIQQDELRVLTDLRKDDTNAVLTQAEKEAIAANATAQWNLERAELMEDIRQSAIEIGYETDAINKSIEIIGEDSLARREAAAMIDLETQARIRKIAVTDEERAAVLKNVQAGWELDQAQEAYNNRIDVANQVSGTFVNSLTDVLRGTKSLKSAFADILNSIIDMIVQYSILIPLQKSLAASMGAGAGGGGFFTTLMSAFAFHKGGVVGAGSDMTRDVHPGVFSGAKKLHKGGLAANEVPIIAKKDEVVAPLSRGSDGTMGIRVDGGSGGSTHEWNVSIDVNVNGGASGSDDPVETGRQVGKAVEAKFLEMVRRESRPGGLLARN